MSKKVFRKVRFTQSGFSLIELSVVLVIIGFMVVAALQAYRIYDEKSKIERMNILMATVDQTLQKFYEAEGRFPCPAAVNGSAAGNDYDAEECGGRFGVLNVAGTGTGRVLIGKVPAATLGLSSDYMRDIYGSYLTYAVTQAATVDGGSVQGEIRVREENIDRAAGSSTFGQIVELENHTNITYLIISAGPSRIGAYNHAGVQAQACAGSSKDRENCNGDGVFISSLLSHASNGNNAGFYDDRVAFRKDDDISSSGRATTLRIGREGRDYDRVPMGRDGEEIRMKKDGYLVTTISSSGDGPNARYNSTTKMTPLVEGDVIGSNARSVPGTRPNMRAVTTLNGEVLMEVDMGGRGVRHLDSGREGPSGEYVFSNEYSGNGGNISNIPTISGGDGGTTGGGNRGEGYDYTQSYTGYVWVE